MTNILKKINQLSLKNTKINLKFEDKKIETKLLGIYSLNEKKFFEFNNQTNFFENKYTSTLNAETDENIEFDLLNYKKTKGNVAKLFFDLEKKDDQFKINQFTLKEKENLFSINNLIFKNDKFISFKEILVKTSVDEKINNDFKILYGKKISIIGKYLDATNLPKYFNKKSGESNMININKDIEIDFSNIIAPKSEKLRSNLN